MGCYIKKYEELSKLLGLPENLTIVRNGFSKFYGKPSNDCSLELYIDLLRSLNLEVAFADSVNEFNAIYKHHETQFSISIIDWMKIDHLNYMDHNDNEYEPPYRYTLLDNWLKETRTNSILDDYYIISMEDAHKYRLLLDYVYCEPVLAELNLVRVKKTIYHNRFNPVVNRNFTGIVSFMEVDVNSTGELKALFPSIHINYGELAKAAQKLKKSIKSLSKEMALATKGYYLDIEDGVLTIADTQMAKCYVIYQIEQGQKLSSYVPTDISDLGNMHTSESQYTCSGTISIPSDGTIKSHAKGVCGIKIDETINEACVLEASDIEDVLNSAFKKTKLYKRLEDIRFRYIGKPNTESNRMAMGSEIEEIFDEISHSTGDVNLIDGEWCECQSSPSVIVNIGSVNIDSKKEPCPTYDKLLADRITKALKSLVD